jgi:hypothetical protein
MIFSLVILPIVLSKKKYPGTNAPAKKGNGRQLR